MTLAISSNADTYPLMRVDVHEPGVRARGGRVSCKIGEELKFSAEDLSSYFFAKWNPTVFDALLVAAAVEFCDRTLHRPLHHWAREFQLRIPVHNLRAWNDITVKESLVDALCFLTGDRWLIEFVERKKDQSPPLQSSFELPRDVRAVIPFSEGMDSRAVAGLVSKELGAQNLVRVRLGSKVADAESLARYGQPFASVPYEVRQAARFADTSARSRGFKFATISGLSAYLAKAPEIIVPESGQGSLGPALVPVGQTYEDYRNHPVFTGKMERYLYALLGHKAKFIFPRLWHTKAETLRAFVETCPDGATWKYTRSCWQGSRQVSVDGRRRQCGICAACMLRRQSVHGAGLHESRDTYVWERLNTRNFEEGAAKGFAQVTGALRDYAIAGTLHLDHLAALRSSKLGNGSLELCAFQLGKAINMPEIEVRKKLDRLLAQHETEWRDFVKSLGKQSFVADWAAHTR